ncbi:MAG: phytanoyl-CoA dioxygenase family protein [Caldilineaceae bacterium]|nr:phytanoyl-CoA dioxygenase family protein [Caldilineaceae bacterium]
MDDGREFIHVGRVSWRSPFAVPTHLSKQVEVLGLAENIRELADKGSTVIQNVAPPEFIDGLRSKISELCKSDLSEGRTGDELQQATMLFGRDSVFVEACLMPKILVLAEVIVGGGFHMSNLVGILKPPSEGALQLHTDTNWLPEPYPEHPATITCCWATETLNRAAGCTKAVPGSHRARRQPTLEEAGNDDLTVPLECEAGDVPVWLGETWHGNYSRQLEGERVTLHMSMTRHIYRPMENYDYLSDEWIDKQSRPDVVRQLLRRDGYIDKNKMDWGKEADYISTVTETIERIKR